MTFSFGGVDVTAVHVGAAAAEAVYLGAEKVWPGGPVRRPLVTDARYNFAGSSTGAANTPGNLVAYSKGLASFTDLDGTDIWTTILSAYAGQAGLVTVTYLGVPYQEWTGNFTSLSHNRWTMTHADSFTTDPPLNAEVLLTATLV